MQERWQRVKSLFGRARALSATGQQALLRQTDDTSVRAEVASLIGADQQAGDFLQTPSAMPDHARRGHLGPYRILMPLGRGGMGHVYLAMRDDGSYQKRVAIKTIAADSRDCPPAFIDRFRNERQILAALDHPGIVRLLDGGQDPSGLPYLVMEYVQGVPIDQACQRGGLGLPLADFCDLLAAFGVSTPVPPRAACLLFNTFACCAASERHSAHIDFDTSPAD